MPERPYRGPIDHDRLGEHFRALSVPTRILLLSKLQIPRTPSEIDLPPFRRDPGLREDRALSRQAVQDHLDKLVEVGLVRTRAARREGQPAREYYIDEARLFTLVDEVRRLALLRAPAGGGRTASRDATFAAPGRDDAEPPLAGASLVLVSGPHEGRAYPLAGPGPWTVGRGAACAVPLGYDPFVSSENCEVRRDGDRFFVRALPGSRNGTTVNWRLVGPDADAPLVSGDTLGVGRSLLVARGVGP